MHEKTQVATDVSALSQKAVSSAIALAACDKRRCGCAKNNRSFHHLLIAAIVSPTNTFTTCFLWRRRLFLGTEDTFICRRGDSPEDVRGKAHHR